ncbi:MAG: TIGR03619 family F420-dependent LLM class oxidoreductase [Deltaproteobacteria bacterium]|nr:TIGR03619 family F420-dependent LLM class oxidoreductase [Deltaproteobacteria bacterium]
MKLGITLLNFGPAATPESLARSAGLAEALGYHLVTISDHVALTPDVQSQYPAPFYDPLITLAWLAANTSKIELGTSALVVPYRHPLNTAKMASNIDRLSNGRFILGVGVGWAEQEYKVLGVPFRQRGEVADDYLRAIKTFWTTDVATCEGKFVSFRDVHTAPKPVRSPHPPIWIGGSSQAAIRRAVRYGNAWHPLYVRADWLRDQALPRLREIASQEGKPVPALCPRIKLRLTDSPLAEDERVAGEGTLDQVRRDFEVLESLGTPYVLLDGYADDPQEARSHQRAWHMFATIAEKVFDLERCALR